MPAIVRIAVTELCFRTSFDHIAWEDFRYDRHTRFLQVRLDFLDAGWVTYDGGAGSGDDPM